MRFCKLIVLFFLATVVIFAQSSELLFFSPWSLPILRDSRLYQISSFDRTGGNDDRINLKPDETRVIANIDGPGIITRIWITIDSRDPYFLRRILLRMYWDGEKNPSVEVPVGDFFGTGFEYRHYVSQFVGMSSGGYYCYFPMPFNKSAKIEVVNETGMEVYAFYYHIDYQKVKEELPENVGYFHAFWKRDIKMNSKKNYVVLEAEGEGQFVGLNMNMQSYDGRLWFLEGDEMVYVDGEKFPSVYGTGTEDYFTSGWYFNKGEFCAPYHGLIIKDDSLARIAAYRFHVGDAIPFNKSLKFTIEHGHANTEVVDYSSTAYWYQKEPHKPFPPMIKASLRIPLRVVVPADVIEGEDFKPKGRNIEYSIEDMSDYGPDWSGLKQLRVTTRGKGREFYITLDGLEEDKYNLDVYYTKGEDYGNYKIFANGKTLGKIEGFSETVVPAGKVSLKSITPDKKGKIKLSFKCTGKAKKSSGYAIGIDALHVEPDRKYISEWYIIGPFPNPRRSEKERLGLDIVYPPEREIDFEKVYVGADSQLVSWKLYKTPKDGRFHLWDKVKPYELVVTYAFTYIYSPNERDVPLLIGSDDGIKVFVNGKPVYKKLLVRISEPDQDRINIHLKKGWNTLLLKIENNFGGYAFFARVIDFDNELIITPVRK